MTQLLAGTAIIHEGKILLLQHKSDTNQNGKWGPPAGHGEPGENPEQTAIRETKEETNLDITLTGIVQVGYFNYQEKDYLYVFYLAKANDLSLLKVQAEEATDYAWASLEELESNKYAFRKEFLQEPVKLALTQEPSNLNLFKIYEVEL